MKKLLLIAFAVITGFTQAQVKKKTLTTQKPKTEKKWVNPVQLTKEQRNRPYMDEVLKTRDSITPEEAERRRKNIAIGNPFEKYGYYPKIATLSKGKYLEFHDTDSIVVIGSIRYNTKSGNIIEVREIDLSDPDAQPIGDTHGRWISPDPLSEEFSDWTPYNYANTNPINNIDPTGLATEGVLNDYKLNQNGKVELVKTTDDKSDTLYATDKKGDVDKSKSVTVDKAKASDGSIISDLAKTENSNGQSLSYTTTSNREDALNVFQFAASNSIVEWSIESHQMKDGSSTFALGTFHNIFKSPSFSSGGLNLPGLSEKTIQWDMHSHGYINGTNGPSQGPFSDSTDRRNLTTPNRYVFRTAGAAKGTVYQYGKNGNRTFPTNFSDMQKNTFFNYSPFMK